MSNSQILKQTNKIFFDKNDISKSKVLTILTNALHKCEDGEIYFEDMNSENFIYDDGRLKNVSYNNSQGFGIRSLIGEIRGYAHSSEINEHNIKKAADTIRSISNNYSGIKEISPRVVKNRPLYTNKSPLENVKFNKKVRLLQDINE